MHDDRNDDDKLFEQLAGVPDEAIEVPDALREAIYRETLAPLRWRRTRRRLAYATTIAAAYAAGIASMALMNRDEPVVPETVVVPVVAPKSKPAVQVAIAPESIVDAEAFALRLSKAPREEQIALLREAANYYLDVQRDQETATRLYARMLNLCGQDECTAIEQDDTWLLASLKRNRLEGGPHETFAY